MARALTPQGGDRGDGPEQRQSSPIYISTPSSLWHSDELLKKRHVRPSVQLICIEVVKLIAVGVVECGDEVLLRPMKGEKRRNDGLLQSAEAAAEELFARNVNGGGGGARGRGGGVSGPSANLAACIKADNLPCLIFEQPSSLPQFLSATCAGNNPRHAA